MAINNSQVSMTFNSNDVRTIGLNTQANIPVNSTVAFPYSNGSSALQANVLYQNIFTLSGTTEIFDFFAGTFADSYGTAVVLTGVVAFQIQNLSATNVLVVGDNSTSEWDGVLSASATNTLQPGDCWQQATKVAGGWAVTSSHCRLLFTGTSGQTFSLAFLGVGT